MGFTSIVGCMTALLILLRLFAKEEQPLIAWFIIIAPWVFNVLFAFTPPLMLTMLIMFTVVGCDLCHLIKHLCFNINKKTITQKEIANAGLDILGLFDKLEKTFGAFVTFELIYSSFTLIVGLFFSVGLIPALQSENWLNFKVGMGVYELITTLLCLFRLIMLFMAGQALSRRSLMLRKEMENYHMEEVESMSKTTTARMENVLFHLRNKAPFRPHDTYDLNMSSGLTVTSVLITYVVILMQFKVSEQ